MPPFPSLPPSYLPSLRLGQVFLILAFRLVFFSFLYEDLMGGKKHKDVPPCSRPTSCPGRLTSSRQTLAAINLVHLNLPSPLLPCYNLRSYQLRPATYSCVYWKLWFHQNPLLLIYIFFVCVFFLVRASAFVCLRIRVYSFGFVLSGCCFFTCFILFFLRASYLVSGIFLDRYAVSAGRGIFLCVALSQLFYGFSKAGGITPYRQCRAGSRLDL